MLASSPSQMGSSLGLVPSFLTRMVLRIIFIFQRIPAHILNELNPCGKKTIIWVRILCALLCFLALGTASVQCSGHIYRQCSSWHPHFSSTNNAVVREILVATLALECEVVQRVSHEQFKCSISFVVSSFAGCRCYENGCGCDRLLAAVASAASKVGRSRQHLQPLFKKKAAWAIFSCALGKLWRVKLRHCILSFQSRRFQAR